MTITVLRQGSALAGGRYVLERRLGAGGMATVWLATDERLQRRVAIKLPSEALLADESFALRFEREAQTAAALSHPSLVPVYDFGTEGDRPYLVSEYIEGASLAQLRDRNQAPATVDVAEAVLAALDHIHTSGIIHRDVKPGNVLVEPTGRILLTDFGIAQSTEETRLTKTGNVIGTLDYLAPELRKGDRATPASDLYACGVLLREQLREHDPDRLHDLVEELTAEDPDDRPRGAASALAVLDGHPSTTATSIEDPSTPTAPQPVVAPPAPPARSPASVLGDEEPEPPRDGEDRMSPRALALSLLAAGLIAVAVVGLATSGGSDDPEPASTTQAERPAAEDEPQVRTVTETTPGETTTVPAEEPAQEETPSGGVAAPEEGSIEEAIALNDEGFALLSSGDAEGALPLLEQSVAAWPDDSTDLNHAYALFNYAQALRLTGNPEAAIPLLEQRLSFSDNQVDEVEAELKLAEKEAKKAAKG
jgi:serine/threonine protein kinase